MFQKKTLAFVSSHAAQTGNNLKVKNPGITINQAFSFFNSTEFVLKSFIQILLNDHLQEFYEICLTSVIFSKNQAVTNLGFVREGYEGV